MSKKKKNGNSNGNGNVSENGNRSENGNGNGNGNGGTKSRINIVARSQHQKDLLKSIKENVVTIVAGPPGSGKAQRLTSTIYTPNGPVMIGDLRVGDEVCTPDGGVAKVASLHPQGLKDVYRVNFADGDYVECCEDHLWKVRDKYKIKKKYKTDERIVDTKYLIKRLNNSSSYSRNRFKIDTPSCCFFEEQEVAIAPYLLGVLLGDGGLIHNFKVTTADDYILQEVTTLSNDHGCSITKCKHRSYDYSIVSSANDNKNNILNSLKEYGLWGLKSEYKFVPDEYKINSREVRLAVLQGLMDTDGTVSKKAGVPQYSTSSYQLAIDVKFLVESLGGICTISKKEPFYYDVNRKKVHGKTNYICNIRYNIAKDLFRLKRKKDIVKNRTKYLTKRAIRSIEKVGIDKCVCIYIDSDEHMYITDNFVPTHNTMLSVVTGLREFIMGKYSKLIFTRPCVEANGENLGFLPGDLNEKIHPYMYPIFDFLGDYLTPKHIEGLIRSESIVTLPLAFQRGMTFRNSFVILDEAQNTNTGQIRMFLTRIGENCKVVITGDPEQSDIRSKNGLVDACERLTGIEGLGIVYFTNEDIVRHPIVAAIEEKYKTQ